MHGLDAVDVVDVEHVHEDQGMAAWAEAGVLQEGPAVLLEFGQQLPVVVVARRQMDRLAGDHIEDRVLGQSRVPIDLARVVRQQQVLAVGRQREGLRRQRLLKGGRKLVCKREDVTVILGVHPRRTTTYSTAQHTHIGRVGHDNVLGESEQVEHADFVPLVQVQELVRADPFAVELLGRVFPFDDVLQLQALTLYARPLIGRRQ